MPEEEVQVLDASGQPPGGAVPDLCGLLDGDSRRKDELRLLIPGITKLGVPEKDIAMN